MDAQDERQSEEAIAKAVRSALGAEQFDYQALVAGVHQRAGRIRRRRAIVTGAAAAVLAPALIGGAALVLPNVLDGDSASVVPAGPGDVASATTEAPDDAAATSVAPQVPWQVSAPPLPKGGFEVNPDLPNPWTIPDARPTGVDFLDSLGLPQRASNYPREVPVSGPMTCDPERPGGIEPEAGQSFSYFSDAVPGRQVDIQVTGWADSEAALDGLVNDSTTLCSWDPVELQTLTWQDHEGDDDYVLYAIAGSQQPMTSAAIVRTGDYLVAVTVADGEGVATTDVAAEIADKTAANLEILDPVHGQD